MSDPAPNTNQEPDVHTHFYAGPLDGGRLKLDLTATKHRAAPVNGVSVLYLHSFPWSEHFKRRTFVPADYKGRPLQEA